jgi:hypothetical protein
VGILNSVLPKRRGRILSNPPKKITFKYLQHDINDVSKEVEKHQGKNCIKLALRLY